MTLGIRCAETVFFTPRGLKGVTYVRIGIDVGGTNTDAVLMNGNKVITKIKTPTTADVTTGITTALKFLIESGRVIPEAITGVMIGTTHFTNAVVERRRLQETAVLRLGLPATAALPPMVDWPADLRDAIGNHWFLVHGGHEFDGRPLSEIRPEEILEVAREIGRRGIHSVAISSVFSPVNGEAEKQAAMLVRQVLPDAAISLSHEIGRMGLLERENAAILNACLQDLALTTVNAFRRSLRDVDITAPLYIAQNDGTLMSADYAEQYPVSTFSSGPTNSMRGAAFLSGLKDAMVVDIGGTTADVGALIQGFPREASVAVQVGGVRTNFRMPDVLSIGLGGGSLVQAEPLKIGPQSVGYELLEKALVFGGDVLTTTDIAVAAGYADIGDRSKVTDIDPQLVAAAVERIHTMVEEAIDRMKLATGDIPVVLVGGGSILINRPLTGASEVVKPDHFEAANAVGAAIAQISGEVDRIFSLDKLSRDQALNQAKAEAVERAVAAGAEPTSVQVVDVEDVPLAYLPSNATRVRVKTVGDLAFAEGGQA
jgi:N-methylhydantoinase A/oxoprolinase/acetone carboxylase beta subunit